MSCGSWCVYYRDKPNGICSNCPSYENGVRPKADWLPSIDPFKLADELAKKQEKDRRNKIPLLSNCPRCGKHSLFYDRIHDKYECLNKDCLVVSPDKKDGD